MTWAFEIIVESTDKHSSTIARQYRVNRSARARGSFLRFVAVMDRSLSNQFVDRADWRWLKVAKNTNARSMCPYVAEWNIAVHSVLSDSIYLPLKSKWSFLNIDSFDDGFFIVITFSIARYACMKERSRYRSGWMRDKLNSETCCNNTIVHWRVNNSAVLLLSLPNNFHRIKRLVVMPEQAASFSTIAETEERKSEIWSEEGWKLKE